MAATVFPVCLQQTLHEAYVLMLSGFLSALLSVVVATAESAAARPWTHFAPTEVHWSNIMSVFGALALSYGAALVTPGIQAGHPDPQHMPQNILVSMAFVTAIYLTIALVGFAQYGCATPSNLLESMSRGVWRKIGFGLMQLHITIAFPVILNPALVTMERALFREDNENNEKTHASGLELALTPGRLMEHNEHNEHKPTPSPSFGANLTRCPKKLGFRSTVVVAQMFLAMVLREAFSDAADFIGATTITLCCIVFPLVFKVKMFGPEMHRAEKALCLVLVILSTVLGLYTAYLKLVHIIESIGDYRLFSDAASDEQPKARTFPLCPAGYVYD